MPVSLDVIPRIDEREARRTAEQATRAFANAGRQAGQDFGRAMGAATGADLSRNLENYNRAFGRAADSAGKLRVAEERLNEVRDRGITGSRLTAQMERVESLRRAETRAVREATAALDQYQVSARRASETAGAGRAGIFSGFASGARQAGEDAADNFSGGFAGSGAIARLAAAGGPVGLALLGVAAVGFTAGKLLADNLSEGLASLEVKDFYQARLAVDDATMAQLGESAAKAYANGYGESLEANLSAMQLGIQGRLLKRGAPAEDAQTFIEKTDTLSKILGEDPQAIVRGTRGFLDSGLVKDYTEAYDLLNAAQAKGLNLSEDLLDTAEEYGTKFRDIGINGVEAFGLISQMVEGGARNVDVAADGLKEFAINATDGSKLTKQAFEALGFDAEEMARKFSEGGPAAKQATGEILTALGQIEDPVQRNQIGLALFKTKWEDMGKAVQDANLDTAAQQLGDVNGSLDTANGTMSEHVNQWDLLGKSIDNTFNKLQEWLTNTPVGKFFTEGVPGFLNDFLNPGGPPIAGTSAPDSTKPLNPLDILASGAPGSAQAGLPGLLLPQSGTPLPPGPAPTDRITPVPLVPEADQTTGAAAKPTFDPKQYSLDSIPIGSFPGVDSGAMPFLNGTAGAPVPNGPGGYVVDPGAVFDAQTREMSARNSVEEARQRVLELEADNTSSAADIQSARNAAALAERGYIASQRELTEAQQGTWKKANDAIAGAMGDLNAIFAPLDQDFGISKGLPGLVENLTKMFGNMALAGAIGSDKTLQAAAISLMNPQAGASSAAAGYGYGAPGVGGYGFGGPVGTAAPGESARDFAHRVMMPFFESQGLSVGDHAADKYGEHQNGALDIMVKSIDEGNQVLKQVLSDPNTYGAIFNNQTYGYGHGLTPQDYSAGHTGDPSQDHTNHVHAWYKPGGANNITPAPQLGPLADPALAAYGGGGSVMPGLGMPQGFGPGSAVPGPTQGFGPKGQPAGGAPSAGFQPGVAPQGATGGGGAGITPGGTIDSALQAAASAVPFGGSAAAQIGIKLAERAIQFGGQAAGIGVSGALETFLPSGSPLANFGNSWFGKLAGGFAGARPAKGNLAGQGPPPLSQQEAQAQQAKQGQGAAGQAAGQGITVNYTNNQATEDRAGADLTNHLSNMNQTPGPGNPRG